MKQRSILRDASIKGKALHTGEEVNLTLKPAPANHGIVFRRVDLYGKPEIKPDVSLVSELVRNTTISTGHTKIHTIEHVLSALNGMAVDNVLIEMDASEPPILDGSAKHFVNLIQEAEPVELDAEREYLELTEPVSVTNGSSSLIALPYDGLKITCTSADDRGIHTQHVSMEIDPDSYVAQIAPARTFTIYEDIEELLKLGKIQGGSLDSAIVIKGDKILSKEPLRFKDEFARHKILDVVGDITLLGKPLKAHIIAVRTGHALNAKLCQAIVKSQQKPKSKGPERGPQQVLPSESELDIRRILDTLPHRYPFVMIDRVLEITDNGDRLVAMKNVTYNEPYFLGHFPGQPVMPGVLQVEAMAQAAGILMLRRISSENKIAFFMSCDKVKFRRAVVPGDQMVIEMRLTKNRGNRIGVAEGICKVNGKVVSSAELMFTIAEAGGDM
ncbi:bifunctional UDP-3-O-[3-hydroxymyristoyl] N-acetylglucosamine deacetylase/3-hydroxyacyl-ACP dehydratase [Ruficoccus sp. ZRK36]|uniref:bifunctional UDP-3-O-[3-hydroxymyristoyl] N-acetylglucosamine deacetylase/3-hydroxyacyl-ACP dehydratase n=1 Tax=Ruficoccus sp. ZRK36 TaxID=2866311 RepID=UPI001C73649C|nr:bifunctional UDP-3-O-[3-hydroxymyristoyl] N-acetylglucosamine deacetylase/3-hydroxyacyl-ACP dehydratase [Ruficoccus sp. ZRK36]QYY35964.1 bifunctional UDP-3-O-[3-hydroxymyristoyl] N-acetylglucosamine deacetylase/3-hydroxyacyl-ACP dehydratase [Ruficoccus sp. ZRK36]